MESNLAMQFRDKTLSFSFCVEKGEILQSQRACKSTNLLHTNREKARAMGLENIAVPATMILENAQSQFCSYFLEYANFMPIAVGADEIRLANFAYPGKPITIKANIIEVGSRIMRVKFYCLQEGKSCFDGISTFLMKSL